jgi:signal transduction histidine kinase
VRALGELSRGIGADWDASIQRILKFDAEVLRVERVSLWSFSDQPSSIHCDAGYLARRLAFERGATLFEAQMPEYFAALREARELDIPDVRTDTRCRGLREYCAARGISSLLDVPVWVDGRLAGVLCHEHVGRPRCWSITEEEFAASMSQFVSSALAARRRTAVEAAARRAAFLNTFSLRLTSLDALEIQRSAVTLSVPTLGEASLLWLLRPDGRLDLAGLKHVDPSKEGTLGEAARTIPAEGSPLVSFAVSQRQSLFVPEMSPASLARSEATPTEQFLVTRLGMRTGIAVPLLVGGRALGAMAFLASDRLFDADDLALAEHVAARVASALENARLYELAQEAIRARDDLLVLTAHELRTPLAALQLMTQAVQRRAQRGAQAGDPGPIDDVARQVQRFSAIVWRLLEALKIRTDGVRLVREPCDLAGMVTHRVGDVTRRAERAGSPITVDSPPSVVGRWDRARLEAVIDILLDNAIKFAAGRPIAVTVHAEGAAAELSIHDDGIGISPDRLSAIFQPFERAVSKDHFGGLGLGLYIARAIVEAHGGSIGVTSQPGHGSTFVVRLPLADSPGDEETNRHG